MLAAGDPEEDGRPVLVGAEDRGALVVTLADLRGVAGRADRWRTEQGYAPGDSILLLRLPYSSEVPLAAAAVALMSRGLRVVLPMHYDPQSLSEMAAATNCRAVLRSTGVVETHRLAERSDTLIRDVAEELDLDLFCLDRLDWLGLSDDQSEASDFDLEAPDDTGREVLVLSTSGSTGAPKLVRYTERALLSVAEAFQAGGLMDPAMLGGPSICPTLSHSMGFRNVLHAVWNRQPTLLAQPEWLDEKPKKFVKLLERWPPHHITCGPALLRDLSLLAASVVRVRNALESLKVVVSSGAADPGVVHRLPREVTTANAFGMTEVQQALTTLIDPAPTTPQALGNPLPGVSVAVEYVDPEERIGRLNISSPFMASGYVGEEDFGDWFETGDLVRVTGDDLTWVARAQRDILNTGHGAKVALADLTSDYQRLADQAESVLFVAVSTRGGVGALIYVGDRDPADPQLHQQLLKAIGADHQAMADAGRDFALAYQAISVAGCVAGRPPRRGPGKVDRQRALADQDELLSAMEDAALEHPQLFYVPPHGSDRPDWRQYAADAT